jgi:hypothetical protein
MNRKQAQTLIGKYVLVNEQSEGQYIGELLEVVAEPRKPWNGIVRVISIETLPDQELNADGTFSFQEPIYQNDQKIEVVGSKISSHESEDVINYEQALVSALVKKVDSQKEQLQILTSLVTYLEMLDSTKAMEYQYLVNTNEHDPTVKNPNFIYYLLKQVNNQVLLFDEVQEQYLALEGCPFEFELLHNEKWEKCHYLFGMKFELKNKEIISLKEDVALRIEKQQFEPYQMLMNELEKPALDSLEKSLQSFQMTHEDIVHCHNSLLLQLLHSSDKKQFSGVNFITFETKQHTVFVQHHYERTLSEEDNDAVYDRFEFTTDKGKRSIITYTNQFSRDR